MRLHRFFINQAVDSDEVKIEDEDIVHQWRNVFRYLVGAQVVVFNGDGFDYLAMISELGHKTAVLSIMSKKKSVLVEKNIGLAISIIKKDNMEWVIQKATELGVSKIFPIISERSEKKSLNMSRAKKIAVEASEQSGRGDVPEISEPLGLENFFGDIRLEQFEKKIVFHPKEEKFNTAVIQDESVLMVIGPEGGFSENEMQMFAQNGFKRYSIGNLVLRAETASIAGLSLLLL